jgi:hypothetical protein
MTTYGEWRYSSTILELDNRWRWVVRFTPQPLYPPGEWIPPKAVFTLTWNHGLSLDVKMWRDSEPWPSLEMTYWYAYSPRFILALQCVHSNVSSVSTRLQSSFLIVGFYRRNERIGANVWCCRVVQEFLKFLNFVATSSGPKPTFRRNISPPSSGWRK